MPKGSTSHQNKLAALYVFKALKGHELLEFEKQLQNQPELRSIVRDMESVLDLTNIASAVKPTEEYLHGQRNLLRGRIEQLELEKAKRPLFNNIKDILEAFLTGLTEIRQPAWAVVSYIIIAFLMGRFLFNPSDESHLSPSHPVQPNIRQLIQSGALNAADIDFKGNGESLIHFALQTSQEVNVSGGIEDELIRQVLYYLLLNDQNPGNRLKIVKLMENLDPIDDFKIVLISSLLSDPNPGVRLRSIKLLQQSKPDDLLTNACQKVLLEDENEAVRMGALSIIAISPTTASVPILQVVSIMDKNDFIRDHARQILADIEDQYPTEKIEVIQ